MLAILMCQHLNSFLIKYFLTVVAVSPGAGVHVRAGGGLQHREQGDGAAAAAGDAAHQGRDHRPRVGQPRLHDRGRRGG